MATSRNSSIELLRIFAIFGIVTMHINGELMSSAQGSTAAWIQLENSLFNAGVSVFVLISGYYGIRRTWHKAAVLEITAIVYSALTALLSSMQGGGASLKVVLQAFIPISINQYWFLSCYMLLMLFAPWLC